MWHLPFDKNPDDITVSKGELQSYLDEMNTALPALRLKFDDISMVNTGLTLFGDNDSETKDLSFGKRSILIDHSSDHQIDGLITLIGVRATTARGMAKQAVDLVFKKLDKKFVKSRTHELPIFGGQFENFEKLLQEANSNTKYPFNSDIVKSLIFNYGAKYEGVLKYIKEYTSLADTIGNTLTIKAEIIHAVQEEMAIKLGDVIFRRTDIGTGEFPSVDTVRASAETMGNELGWNENHIQSEIDELKNDLFFRKGKHF